MTLAEIQAALDALPMEEQQQLFLFLLSRLRAQHDSRMPDPRTFSREQIERWIADDVAEMDAFRKADR